MNLPEKNKHLGRNIALISALVIAVGSVLPFAGLKDMKIYGLEVDGKITLFLGTLIIISLLFKKIPKYISGVLASLTLVLAAFDYTKLSETTSSIKETASNPYMTDVAATIQMGSGLQLIMIGAVGVIVGFVIHMIQNKRA